jgi:hypothetical protein
MPKTIAESAVIAEQLVDTLDKQSITVEDKHYYPKLYCSIAPLTPDFAFTAGYQRRLVE